jgi:hypothetical protein
MSTKEPRQSKVTHQEPKKGEKRDQREIADQELDSVSGGLGTFGGAGLTETAVCVSTLG